ncbi:MAG: hypothetical protein KDF62_14595 [Nitrosomonas sp.]|nr:hypothetical protein [Nitrosomonas sp.]
MLPANVAADIVVVVNAENEIDTLTKRQVIDLYMGRNAYFPDGTRTLRFDQPSDSTVRADFYHHLTQMKLPSINAYWARLIFTGRSSAPVPLSGDQEMLEVIENNKYAIGYLNKGSVNNRVKVVFELNSNEIE